MKKKHNKKRQDKFFFDLLDKDGTPHQGQFNYPASLLRVAYFQRRAQMKKLSG